MWRLGGFGRILDAEYGCCKKISAVYGFMLLRGCGKLEFKRTVYGFSLTSYNLLLDNRLLSIKPSHSCNRTVIANCRFRQVTLGFLLRLLEIAILRRIFIVLKKTDGCGL